MSKEVLGQYEIDGHKIRRRVTAQEVANGSVPRNAKFFCLGKKCGIPMRFIDVEEGSGYFRNENPALRKHAPGCIYQNTSMIHGTFAKIDQKGSADLLTIMLHKFNSKEQDASKNNKEAAPKQKSDGKGPGKKKDEEPEDEIVTFRNPISVRELAMILANKASDEPYCGISAGEILLVGAALEIVELRLACGAPVVVAFKTCRVDRTMGMIYARFRELRKKDAGLYMFKLAFQDRSEKQIYLVMHLKNDAIWSQLKNPAKDHSNGEVKNNFLVFGTFRRIFDDENRGLYLMTSGEPKAKGFYAFSDEEKPMYSME